MNGVTIGICGRRGSRDLPDAVSPTVGCRAEYEVAEELDNIPPGVTMLSPDTPTD